MFSAPLKLNLGKIPVWLFFLIALIGCKSDDCETAPCDCEYKDESACRRSDCCEWKLKSTTNYNFQPGGVSMYSVRIEPACMCKEVERNYLPLIEKKISLTTDSSKNYAVAGILEGNSGLTFIARKRKRSGYSERTYPVLISSAFRHLEGLDDIGQTAIFFNPVYLFDMNAQNSQPIHDVKVNAYGSTAIVDLEEGRPHVFQTSTGLKGVLHVDNITEKDNGTNFTADLTLKYYQAGEPVTAETAGLYMRKNVEIEFDQPIYGQGPEQPGAFYNPVTNSNNPTGAPIAFALEKGNLGNYSESTVTIVSPDSRTSFSPLLQNGNLTTTYQLLNSSHDFDDVYQEFKVTEHPESTAKSWPLSSLGTELVFKSSDGATGVISIRKITRLNYNYKTRLMFDIKYIRK